MSEPVIFRRWCDSGTLIAIFPEWSREDDRDTVMTYEYLGQHSEGSYKLIIDHTEPILGPGEPDVEALLKELEDMGYDVRIIKRRR